VEVAAAAEVALRARRAPRARMRLPGMILHPRLNPAQWPVPTIAMRLRALMRLAVRRPLERPPLMRQELEVLRSPPKAVKRHRAAVRAAAHDEAAVVTASRVKGAKHRHPELRRPVMAIVNHHHHVGPLFLIGQ
jgi:hypothetical protein